MAASPQWKIFSPDGEYVASTKYAEDAAVLAAAREGTVVKYQRYLAVWTEGSEEFSAGESYDRASQVMNQRAVDWINEQRRAHGRSLVTSVE
jgi:phytoene dehydrogenase-like protein